MSKTEGTNLSTLGLNNIANYLDYFQGMYRSLILVATCKSNRWLTAFDSLRAELKVQSFDPSSIKMYEILSLRNSNIVIQELIQHY